MKKAHPLALFYPNSFAFEGGKITVNKERAHPWVCPFERVKKSLLSF